MTCVPKCISLGVNTRVVRDVSLKCFHAQTFLRPHDFYFFLMDDYGVGKNLYFSVPFLFDKGLIIMCRCDERSACVSTKENNIFKVKLQIKFARTTLIHKML